MKRTLLALAFAMVISVATFGQVSVPLTDGHTLKIYTNLKSDFNALFDNESLGKAFEIILRAYNLTTDVTVIFTADSPRLKLEVKNIHFNASTSPRLLPFNESDQTFLPLGFYREVASVITKWVASLISNKASPADLVTLVQELGQKDQLPSSFTCTIVNEKDQHLTTYGTIANFMTIEFNRIMYESASGKYRFFELSETASNMVNLKADKFFLEKPDLNTVYPTNYTILIFRFFGLQ